MSAFGKYLCVILLTSILAACGTTAKYHRERNDPIRIAKFAREDACKFVIADEHRNQLAMAVEKDWVQVQRKQRESLGRDIDLCVRADKPYSEHAGVEKQLRLFDFIHDTLPDGWFRKDGSDQKATLLKPHVEVTTRNPVVHPEPPANFFTKLSDRGQQAVVQHLWKNENLDNLKQLLVTLRDSAKESSATDPFSRIRQVPLLISASFNSNTPADRLERAYVFIQPLTGASIVDVDKLVLETQRSKVTLGKETAIEEVSPTLGIENLLLPGDAKAKAGINSSKFGRTLERNLSKEFALRNISLNASRDILFVRQEGQEGIDISGNVLSTIALQLPNEPSVVNLFSIDKSRDAKSGSAPVAVKRESKAFQNVGDVKAAVAWVVVARIVREGRETISEEDDVVEPHIFSGQFSVNLWRNDTVFYSLVLPHKVDRNCYNVTLSYYSDAEKKAGRMAFKSYEEAQRFKEYITRKEVPLGEDGAYRYLLVKSDEGNLKIGFPVDVNGMRNDQNVNVRWTTKGNQFNNDLVNLLVDVKESSDFPMKREHMFKKFECPSRLEGAK
jgi:hypothetical protein